MDGIEKTYNLLLNGKKISEQSLSIVNCKGREQKIVTIIDDGNFFEKIEVIINAETFLPQVTYVNRKWKSKVEQYEIKYLKNKILLNNKNHIRYMGPVFENNQLLYTLPMILEKTYQDKLKKYSIKISQHDISNIHSFSVLNASVDSDKFRYEITAPMKYHVIYNANDRILDHYTDKEKGMEIIRV